MLCEDQNEEQRGEESYDKCADGEDNSDGQEKGQENGRPGVGEPKHILHHVRFPYTCPCHELSNNRTHCYPSYCGNAARARTPTPDTCAANYNTAVLLLDTCNVLAAWAAFRSQLSLLKAAYILYEQDNETTSLVKTLTYCPVGRNIEVHDFAHTTFFFLN